VKTELRALNPINQNRKGFERGAPSECEPKPEEPTPASPKSRPTGSTAPYEKCSETNHTIPECRVGTDKCMWCRSPEYLIAACPRRMKIVDKSAAKPLAPFPTTKVCSSRTSVCDEQKGSCHLWYGNHWNSLFKFKAILYTI